MDNEFIFFCVAEITANSIGGIAKFLEKLEDKGVEKAVKIIDLNKNFIESCCGYQFFFAKNIIYWYNRF